MSSTSAAGGASALNGIPWIIVSPTRDCSSSSATAMSHPPVSRWCASVVGVLKVGVTAVVEGADPLDAVGVDGRAPVGLHHDCDRLFDRLSLTHPRGALHGLHRGRRVARDLLRDTECGVHELG